MAPCRQADDEGEDLYDDNLNRDYVADPVLDAYERGSDDERTFSPATREQQRRAERTMRKRDNEEATRAGRIPRALESSSDEEDSEEEEAAPPPAEKNRDMRTRAATTQVEGRGLPCRRSEVEGCKLKEPC